MKNNLQFQKKCKLSQISNKNPFIVGIHGTNGSFTDQAWSTFAIQELGISPDRYIVKELVQVQNVLKYTSLKKIDVGIFAFSNSGSGGYVASVEAMGKFKFKTLAVFSMPINMCILAHPSVKSMKDIKTFYGHPVAVAQCLKTLSKEWPNIKVKPATDKMDTALSAKLLSTGKLPKSYAVFASERAAKIYGLKILKNGAQHDPNNRTSFAIIKK